MVKRKSLQNFAQVGLNGFSTYLSKSDELSRCCFILSCCLVSSSSCFKDSAAFDCLWPATFNSATSRTNPIFSSLRVSILAISSSGSVQLWPLTPFLFCAFWAKKIIDLPGGQVNDSRIREDAILFHSSRQLPCLRPSKGILSCCSALQGPSTS